jgi:hypothetical protein
MSALKPTELLTYLSIAGSLVIWEEASSAATIRKLACWQPAGTPGPIPGCQTRQLAMH